MAPTAGGTGEEEMQDIHGELNALADHIGRHREAMVARVAARHSTRPGT